jgi:hypothetical protein
VTNNPQPSGLTTAVSDTIVSDRDMLHEASQWCSALASSFNTINMVGLAKRIFHHICSWCVRDASHGFRLSGPTSAGPQRHAI